MWILKEYPRQVCNYNLGSLFPCQIGISSLVNINNNFINLTTLIGQIKDSWLFFFPPSYISFHVTVHPWQIFIFLFTSGLTLSSCTLYFSIQHNVPLICLRTSKGAVMAEMQWLRKNPETGWHRESPREILICSLCFSFSDSWDGSEKWASLMSSKDHLTLVLEETLRSR